MNKKIHRFFIDTPLAEGTFTIKDEALVNQIVRVLKLRSEEPVILFNNNNREATGIITGVSKITVETLIEKVETKTEQCRHVHLYAAILKNENFEYGIQKAVEVGIYSITPVITVRTVKTGLKVERLQKIMTEAAELSGRVHVPELFETLSFEDALARGLQKGTVIMCDVSGKPHTDILQNIQGPISIFIGPEGGWTEVELAQARESGAITMGLGNFTLRGETALSIASFLGVNS